MKIKKMNKNIVKNWTIYLILAVLLVLNSCSNFLSFEENETKKTAVQNDKCTITVSSDFSESEGIFSRAAFPNFVLSSETLYFAEISYTSASSKKWLGEDSVCETAVAIKNNYSDEIRFVFCVPEETASYTFTLYACPKQTESQISAVKTSAFAQGATTLTLSAGQKSLSFSLSIKLKPLENSGTGSVDLPLSFDSTLGILAAEVNVTKDGVSDSDGNSYGFKISVSGSGAALSAENVSAGTYLVIMKFYKSTTDFSSSNEVVVNSAVHQVSVYSGMTTDCWFVDGKKHGTAAADGTFTPSALELTKYDFTELYVCGTDGDGEYGGKRSFYVSSNFGSSVPAASDTDGDGSMAKPFETVQKAVDKIAAANDTSKKYTVYVDGTVTADTIGNYSANNSSFVNISPALMLKLAIKSLSTEKAVIDAGRSSKAADTTGWRVFYIGEKSVVTFENITITGGSLNDAGGGISCDGNLTLKNCVITENKSNNAGGGISFSGNELVLENTDILSNQTESDGGGISVLNIYNSPKVKISGGKINNNESGKNGGAINSNGIVTISGIVEILNNSATKFGGGIYFWGDGEKSISDTTINKNSAESGGGIYMQNGTLNLKIGAIIGEELDPDENDISNVAEKGNCGNWSTKILSSSGNYAEGAGICVEAGTVNMEDGAYICRNYTECSGGGIVIKSGTFNMTGGTVGWNYSNHGGGIRCDGNLKISGNSKICYNKVSTQYVQGFCGRGAGILVNGENGATAEISGSTAIFGNLAVKWSSDSDAANQDAMGAGIYCSGTLVVTGGKIYNNSSESDGPAIAIENGTATLSGCEIYGNKASRYGGAIFVNRTAANIEANLNITINEENKNVQIHDNTTTEEGGAIYIGSGTATISGCEISENHATGDGGAIFVNTNNSAANAQLIIKENVSIKENFSNNNGGAIYATASVKESYVNIGEDGNTEGIVISGNGAKRGGAFYGADNARFVMNAGKVSENYSSKKKLGDGGGALFLWGGASSYSTFLMNGGEIRGNMAKNGGAGGAVYIDHGDGVEKSTFIMKGGLLSGNKATDENGNESKLGGAIYLKAGGKIELSGSAVIDVEKDCNDIYLGISDKSVQQKITITGELTPKNNVTAGNPKYTARITPQTYTVGKELFQSDTYTITSDDYGKFCVTGNAESDEWFITSAGYLSKPMAISGFSDVPDFNKYPKLTVSTGDDMKKLADWVKKKNTMSGYLISQMADIMLPDTFTGIGVYNMSPSVTNYVFSGTFDGKGHKITSSGTKTVSIFNNLQSGGGIKNVISEGKFLYAGIAYYCDNGIIENCENNATISNSDSIGGIVGKLTGGTTISNCINKGDIEASYKGGGICGWSLNSSNSILNCINLGKVTGSGTSTTLGAIVATNSGNVKNTYYLIGTADQAIGGSNSVASDVASSFDSSLKTPTSLTVEGTTSNNLIDLLNAWVTANSTETEQYLEWDRDADGKPALVY